MSRRKQTKPQHIESEDTLVSILENGSSSASQSEDEALTGDEHVCGKCRGEFVDLASFLGHKKHCCRKRVVFIVDDEYEDDLEGDRNLPFLSETEDFYAEETETAAQCGQDSSAPNASSSFPSNVSDDVGLVPSMSSLSMPSKCQEDVVNNNEVSDKKAESSTVCAATMVKSEDDQGGTEDKAELMEVEFEESKEQISTDSLAVSGKEPSGVVPLPHLPLLSPSLYSAAFPYDSSPALSSNVLLQSLPNTKVAVSQISAAAATVLNGDKINMQSAKASELVMLQSTLYNLQQQQMLQLQLIQQLQQQLIANNVNPVDVATSGIISASGLPNTSSMPVLGASTSIASIAGSSGVGNNAVNSLATSPVSSLTAATLPLNPLIVPTTTPPTTNSGSSTSSSSSTIGNIGGNTILNVGSPSDLKEPNSLELLQRSAQQVLNNASQGLLAADLQFRNGSSKNGKGGLSGYDSKTGHYSRSDDAFFKHRCRYCGKVFGSDSALQIHIRSHTGERPFKCNVCGNRFSTKGNLKVHFQRHKMKYPHIRMNPHPVPEHLDKYVIPLQPPSPVGPMMSQSLSSPTPHHHPHHHHHHHHHHHRAHPLSIPPHLHSQFSPITPPPPSSSSFSALPPTSLAMDLFSKSVNDHHHHQQHQRHQGPHRTSSSHTFGLQMNDHTLVASSLGLAPLPTTSRRMSDDMGSPPPPLLTQGLTSTPLALTMRPSKSDSPSSVITKAPQSPDISDEEDTHDMDDYEREDNERRSMDGSPISHMQDEQYPDDDMDDLDSISGESLMSHSMRHSRFQHHEGTSQPLPPSASLIEMHTSSRHSAPPIATFSSLISERSSKNEDRDGFPGEAASDEVGDKNCSRDENQRRAVGSSVSGNAREGSERPGSPSLNMAQDVTMDPAIYTPLLPKPGSNDNSWESLIEITKTSETSKLQQLVDNIEHKLSDPNQCVICNRVLSCKSALQMHYRTHTGERPFKCKICGRAFTTKGNLKTHMGVHRAKPPMRVLHQCPVCHKKFTNALVLQQHIRMHTGEPTDMTPEQIQAAEIKEFSQPHMGHPGGPGVIIPTTLPHLFTPMSLSMASLGSPITSMIKGVPLRGSGHLPSIKTEPGTTTIPKSSGAASPASSSSTAGRSTCTPNQTPGNRGVIRCGSAFSESDKDMEQDRPRRPDSHESPAPATSQPTNLIASFSTSLAALENHVKNISTPPPSLAQFGHLMAVASGALPPQHRSIPEDHHHHHQLLHHHQHSSIATAHHQHSNRHRRHSEHGHNGTKRSPELRPPHSPRYHDEDNASERISPSVKREADSPRVPANECSMPGSPRSPSPTPSASSLTNSEASISASALDLTPRSSMMSQSLSALGSMAFDPSNPSALGLVPSLGSLPISMIGRSNTTCNICLKTFACNSALEIHYRSHTKERPFKCDVCDRAFSTKGNMKQHMLTHKIRDLPAQFFDKGSESVDTAQSSRSSPPPPPPPPPPPQQVAQISPSPAAMAPHLQSSHHQSISLLQSSSGGRGDGSTSNRILGMMAIAGESPSKRPASDSIGGDHLSSNAKRSPGLSKHLCHVCNKNFSSASALQIHMRTHTGDKPFKCNVCERAFTTKGNLKVHMGTHMWNNGASRRGRRMSIDLPPLPLTPKDGDYHLSRRPEHLYFPYLTSPFLNGMATKMNEISVIQSAVLNNGGLVSPPSVSMAMAAAASALSTMSGVSSSTITTTDSAATALRHSTELDLSCKKSPLPAEGARSSPSPNSCSPTNKSSAPTPIRLTCGNSGKLPATPLSSRSPSPAMSPPGREEAPLGSSINGPWLWKMACNMCNKICTSPNELENHLKVHYKMESKDHLGDIPKTEGLPV